jgi:hypothetical protein
MMLTAVLMPVPEGGYTALEHLGFTVARQRVLKQGGVSAGDFINTL